MNALCAICQDLLVPSSDIFVTPCGHVFHWPCLLQWLEKSLTCPECRRKVVRNQVTRIYFNFTSSEDVKEDSVSLQQKVDSLSFQVKLKETEYKNCVSDNASLKRQFNGLREEFKKVESELHGKKAVIRAMKEESNYFQDKCKQYDKLKEEKNKLERQILKYENIRTLLCENEEQVNAIISNGKDVHTLAIYVAVMKKELTESLSKRKELRETVRRLQQELQSARGERSTCIKNYSKQIDELTEALAIAKSENDMLHNKIAELKEGVNESDNVNEEASESNAEEGAVSRKRGMDFDADHATERKKLKGALEQLKFPSSKSNDDSDIVFVSPVPVRKPKENEENSPYLRTKSKSVLTLSHKKKSEHNGFSLKHSTLSSKKQFGSTLKNSQRQDSAITFDGFGGHSKTETFPLPKTSPSKLKRSLNDFTKNKKIKLDLINNKHLDDFVINLT